MKPLPPELNLHPLFWPPAPPCSYYTNYPQPIPLREYVQAPFKCEVSVVAQGSGVVVAQGFGVVV